MFDKIMTLYFDFGIYLDHFDKDTKIFLFIFPFFCYSFQIIAKLVYRLLPYKIAYSIDVLLYQLILTLLLVTFVKELSKQIKKSWIY